jgi:hypothetical protein
MRGKPVITYGMALLLLLGLFLVFWSTFQGVTQPLTPTESFGEALWGTWGVTIVIVSFILFSGGAGILVLLGGGWRWE